MQTLDRELVMTTSDVAELLSIHPSTVKRWCGDGTLRAGRTDGGHRRFLLADVLEAARHREVETFLDGFTPYEAHVWSALEAIRSDDSFEKANDLAMGWLARGRHDRLARLYEILARHPSVPLPRLLDHGVGAFMARVGTAWREGRIRVGEEHLVTQTLVEVLLGLRRELPAPGASDEEATPSGSRRPGRLAVVGSTEGDEHHLGALCVRLTLEMEGWETLYLGPSVPVEDFASLQRSRRASLVCISFSPSGTGAAPHRAVRILETLYDPARPYSLALGGTALEEHLPVPPRRPFVRSGVFAGCTSFLEALRSGFGLPAGARRASETGPSRASA